MHPQICGLRCTFYTKTRLYKTFKNNCLKVKFCNKTFYLMISNLRSFFVASYITFLCLKYLVTTDYYKY